MSRDQQQLRARHDSGDKGGSQQHTVGHDPASQGTEAFAGAGVGAGREIERNHGPDHDVRPEPPGQPDHVTLQNISIHFDLQRRGQCRRRELLRCKGTEPFGTGAAEPRAMTKVTESRAMVAGNHRIRTNAGMQRLPNVMALLCGVH